MKSIYINNHSRKISIDLKFFFLVFLSLTVLALFNGVKSSVYYSFKNISTNWFHLSYHYLASGWVWLTILPLILLIRKNLSHDKQFMIAATIIALPLSFIHRSVAVFSDLLFRWYMGYIKVDPISGWKDLDHLVFSGVFDSFLVYGLIIVFTLFFYKRKSLNRTSLSYSDLKTKKEKSKRIVAKKNGKLILLKLDDISAFKSEGNYLKVYFDDDWVIIRKTAKKMEQQLDSDTFYRVNRSVIINIEYVKNLEPYFSGRYLITMKNNIVYKSSKTFKQSIDHLLTSD